MNIPDLVAVIERTAPPAIAASWDKSGLQVPAGRGRISHLAVCLDPTPRSLSVALRLGADMVLSHHPLTLEPRFPDREDAYLQSLRLLLRADVPLYAAHTTLDANPEGPSAWLADRLELTDRRVLEPTADIVCPDGSVRRCGFGLVGTAPDLSVEALAKILAEIPSGGCPRLTGALPSVLRRVAICTGSGSSLAEAADASGAQVLITGDLKYHAALEAPLPILDVGHFSLEEEMMRLFALDLENTLADVAVTFVPADDPLRAFLPTPQPLGEENA